MFIETNLLPKARQVLDFLTTDFQTGVVTFQELVAWHRRIVDLEWRLAESDDNRIALLESHRALVQQWQRQVRKRFEIGAGRRTDLLRVEFEAAEMDLRLLEARASASRRQP